MAETGAGRGWVLLALYQDTQGSTAVLMDQAGRPLGRSYAMITQHRPRPDWVEYDPLEIWQRSWQAVEQVCKATGVAREEVAAAGITAQQGTVMVWERSSGRPLTPAVSWRCARTAELCRELAARGADRLVHQRSGGLLDTTTAGPKLAWLLANTPGLRERARRGEVCGGTVDSWLLWNLTGGASHLTDHTCASDTLLLNLRTGDWDDELLSLLDVPRSMLPEVRASGHAYGHLPGGRTPITALCADQQAGLFGQACFDDGMLKVTYGRDAIAMLEMDGEPPDTEGRLRVAAAVSLEGEKPRLVLEGRVLTAGLVVEWLRDELALIPTVADSELLAGEAKDRTGLYLVPAFQGLGAPYWNPDVRGHIAGLTAATSRAHLARAALEGIAFRIRDIVEEMGRWSGRPVTEVRADGGAAANSFLLQFQADLLGVPVRRNRFTHAAVMGAAYLAGLQAGLWSSRQEIAALWPEERSFAPSMDEPARQRLYQGWQAVIRQVLAGATAPSDGTDPQPSP